MLRSILCNYSDAYIHIYTVPNTAVAGPAANNRKNIIIKNCALFTNCISGIRNTQVDNTKDINIVMPMYNLIEYSGNYSKTSRILWHYYRDEPFLKANSTIDDFPADNNNSSSFKFKTKIVGRTENDGTNNVKSRVPLKCLSNFWRALEIILVLSWYNRCFMMNNCIAGQDPTFTITDTNIYVLVVTLSTQNNAKLLEQLKLVFKRKINRNEYESKVAVQERNQYLDFLVYSSCQVVNTFFALSFQNNGGRTNYWIYYLPLVEIKGYNIMIDGQFFLIRQ